MVSPGWRLAAESEPKTPVPPVGDTTLTSKNITGVEREEPALRASAPHKDHKASYIKQRRAKARIPANKYSQVPAWAAKMFETNWQDKAFGYQYKTYLLNRSRSSRKS